MQLLGFALYADAGYIERLLAAFGSEAQEAAAPLATLMPGPHPVLRSLLSISAGTHLPNLMSCFVLKGRPFCL